MKRILSIVAAIALLVTFMVPAFATDPTYSITVNNARVGETYNAYKIFDVTYNGTAHAYTYESASYGGEHPTPLDTLVAELAKTKNGDDDVAPYIVLTKIPGTTSGKTVYKVTAGTAMDATQGADPSGDISTNFAKKLQQLYKDGFFTGLTVAGTATTTDTETSSTTTAVFDEISVPGYYFITTTQGSFVAVDTTNPNALIKDKSQAPEIEKEITNFDSKGYNYNDTVDYKVTVTAKNGAVNYKVVDTCPLGFTLKSTADTVGVAKVITPAQPATETTEAVPAVTSALVKGTDYTITITNATDSVGSIITINFTKSFLDTIAADTDIEITYTGVVNEKAVTGGSATTDDVFNQNVVRLTWGNGEEYLYDVADFETADILVTKTGANSAKLQGVKFEVYDAAENGNKLSFVLKDGTYYCVNASTVPTGETACTELVTDANGLIHIDTLEEGDYWFEETYTLDGYNLPTERIRMTVAKDSTDKSIVAGGSYTQTIENTQGVELPETGGIGTIIFVTLGSLAVLAAGIFLISNKRISKEEL